MRTCSRSARRSPRPSTRWRTAPSTRPAPSGCAGAWALPTAAPRGAPLVARSRGRAPPGKTPPPCAWPPHAQLDELPMMVNGVFSSNVQEQYEATQKFRKLLSIGESSPSPPAEQRAWPAVRCLGAGRAPRTRPRARRAQPAHRGGDQDRGHSKVRRVPPKARRGHAAGKPCGGVDGSPAQPSASRALCLWGAPGFERSFADPAPAARACRAAVRGGVGAHQRGVGHVGPHQGGDGRRRGAHLCAAALVAQRRRARAGEPRRRVAEVQKQSPRGEEEQRCNDCTFCGGRRDRVCARRRCGRWATSLATRTSAATWCWAPTRCRRCCSSSRQSPRSACFATPPGRCPTFAAASRRRPSPS